MNCNCTVLGGSTAGHHVVGLFLVSFSSCLEPKVGIFNRSVLI